MKTIGLIGGLSWESSIEYYRLLNEGVKKKLGGLHSAQCLIYSFDFAQIEQLQHQERWDEATQLMIAAAQSIERLIADGAEAIIAGCTEIMLLILQEDCPVPLFDTTTIHADAAIELALQ